LAEDLEKWPEFAAENYVDPYADEYDDEDDEDELESPASTESKSA
jgi:hypothetical protein